MKSLFLIIIILGICIYFTSLSYYTQQMSLVSSLDENAITQSDIRVINIENEEIWYFIHERDTVDYFMELNELRMLGKLGEKIKQGNIYQIGIAIRYDEYSDIGVLLKYLEDIPNDTSVMSLGCQPSRAFKVVDSQMQLHLLDMFIDSLNRKYDPLPLAYINWEMAGAADAIAKISINYYNSTGRDEYSTLKNILEESEMRHDLDSVILKHGFRISDIIIDEGIYYSIPIPESVFRVIDMPTDLTEILYFYATFSLVPSHLTPTE